MCDCIHTYIHTSIWQMGFTQVLYRPCFEKQDLHSPVGYIVDALRDFLGMGTEGKGQLSGLTCSFPGQSLLQLKWD